MTRKTGLRRSALDVAASASLVLGLAACSDDNNDSAASNVSSAAEKATDAAGSAVSSATDAAGSAVSSATDAMSDNAEGDKMVEADSVDGQKLEIPAAVNDAWKKADGKDGKFGGLVGTESNDNGTLVTFENGMMTYSKDTGAVPLIGKIGETWVNGGGLDNALGLPTAPEEGSASNGWTQQFQNGSMEWNNKSGDWGETIVMN